MKRPVLITAGATRNPIDSMRFISANSSGQTGAWLASALQNLGYTVYVLGSPRALAILPTTITGWEYGSTRDLEAQMREWIQTHPTGIVIHCSAVGDFECRAKDNQKISSGQSITLELFPTPKILDQIKDWAPTCILVSFKAAPPLTTDAELLNIASKQLQRTASDLVFANVIGRTNVDVLLVQPSAHQLYRERSDGLTALIDTLEQFSL